MSTDTTITTDAVQADLTTTPPEDLAPPEEVVEFVNTTIDTDRVRLAENAQHRYDEFKRWIEGNVPDVDVSFLDAAFADVVEAI